MPVVRLIFFTVGEENCLAIRVASTKGFVKVNGAQLSSLGTL